MDFSPLAINSYHRYIKNANENVTLSAYNGNNKIIIKLSGHEYIFLVLHDATDYALMEEN